MEPPDLPPKTREGYASAAFVTWVAAIAAFAWVTVILAPNFVPVYSSVEVTLPALTVLSIDVGCFLQQPAGMLLATGAAFLTLRPFLRGNRSAKVAGRYLKAAIALLLVTGIAMYSVVAPAQRLQQQFAEDGSQADAFERPSSPR